MALRLNIAEIMPDSPDWTCKVQIVDISRHQQSHEKKIRFLEDEQVRDSSASLWVYILHSQPSYPQVFPHSSPSPVACPDRFVSLQADQVRAVVYVAPHFFLRKYGNLDDVTAMTLLGFLEVEESPPNELSVRGQPWLLRLSLFHVQHLLDLRCEGKEVTG